MPFNLFSPATWFGGVGGGQQPATGLFQTRTTRTPGVVGDLPADLAGGYQAKVNPLDVLNRTDLTPQQKQTIAQTWAPQGQGFITIAPDMAQRSDVLRHEQMHDLAQKSGMLSHAGEISPLVGDDIKTIIKTTPQYEHEMQVFGPENTIADEGTALDLITYANRMGGPSEALRTKVMQFLKNRIQQKQFAQLTQVPGQPQK